MESLPNSINVYQIAGVDDRERGFNRQAQVAAQGTVYQARLRYEDLKIETEFVDTEEDALRGLIDVLQQRRYTQLRTQCIFQGEKYLGTQELWTDYPDPDTSEAGSIPWFARLRQVFRIGQK